MTLYQGPTKRAVCSEHLSTHLVAVGCSKETLAPTASCAESPAGAAYPHDVKMRHGKSRRRLMTPRAKYGPNNIGLLCLLQNVTLPKLRGDESVLSLKSGLTSGLTSSEVLAQKPLGPAMRAATSPLARSTLFGANVRSGYKPLSIWPQNLRSIVAISET